MEIRTKRDTTDSKAQVTRGVPQDTTSSPILVNMYINDLATEVEEVFNREILSGEIILVADDVLMQAVNRAKLQQIPDVEAWWQERRESKWSTTKSVCIRKQSEGTDEMRLDGDARRAVDDEVTWV